MKPILIHSDASAELDEAVSYYEKRDKGLGLALLTEIKRVLSTIQQDPEIGTPYKRTGFRRIIVHRFPYIVFYVELPYGIWVVAIAHGRRKPEYWRPRRIEN